MSRSLLRDDEAVVRKEDLYLMLVSALRYSMGRQTYIVGNTSDAIKRYWEHMKSGQREVLLRDLKEQLDIHNRLNTTLGAHMDHRVWMDLLRFMQEQKGEADG